MIKLTANQIKHFDEIAADELAVEKTLQIAITHSDNRHNEIEKEFRDLWAELAELHDLDLYETPYKVTRQNGVVGIVPVVENGKERSQT